MRLRILDILKEKGKTKYWLYIQLGLSYQNFNKIVNNETKKDNISNNKVLSKLSKPTIKKTINNKTNCIILAGKVIILAISSTVSASLYLVAFTIFFEDSNSSISPLYFPLYISFILNTSTNIIITYT